MAKKPKDEIAKCLKCAKKLPAYCKHDKCLKCRDKAPRNPKKIKGGDVAGWEWGD